MVETDQSMFISALIVLVSVILALFGGKMLGTLSRVVNAFEKNSGKDDHWFITTTIQSIIFNIVKMNTTKVAELLKEKTADGVLSEEDVIDIAKELLASVRSLINENAINSLSRITDNVDDWLLLHIKSAVIGHSEDLVARANGTKKLDAIGYK